jgi:signal transduction histidine kinase
MASHEFRTPLAIIDGNAQRMKRKADKAQLTPEEAAQRVKKIRYAVGSMTRLMESTLAAARMEEGNIRIEIEPCDIGKVVREVCVSQQEIAPTHVIICDLVGLPETIQADAGSLEQVFTNLLSNAVKYAPGAPDIEVKAHIDGDQVVVSVRDHGLGIDEDELDRIGERFFRATTSTGIAGTGIGVYLVKMLVEEHGGSLNVESIKGEGSTFTISLPVAGPDQSAQADIKVA